MSRNIFKLARAAKYSAVSKHYTLEAAKIAKAKLIRQGKLGYKIYLWDVVQNKWVKW